MRVIVFGATGTIGRGVVRECLLDPGVERVLAIGRSASGQTLYALMRPFVPGNPRDPRHQRGCGGTVVVKPKTAKLRGSQKWCSSETRPCSKRTTWSACSSPAT